MPVLASFHPIGWDPLTPYANRTGYSNLEYRCYRHVQPDQSKRVLRGGF